MDLAVLALWSTRCTAPAAVGWGGYGHSPVLCSPPCGGCRAWDAQPQRGCMRMPEQWFGLPAVFSITLRARDIALPSEQEAPHLKAPDKLVAVLWQQQWCRGALCSCWSHPTHGNCCVVTQEPEVLVSADLVAVFSLWPEEMPFLKHHLLIHTLFHADNAFWRARGSGSRSAGGRSRAELADRVPGVCAAGREGLGLFPCAGAVPGSRARAVPQSHGLQSWR